MKPRKSRLAASVLAVLAASTAPAGAENQSPVEAAYENERALLQASLESAVESGRAALVAAGPSLKDPAPFEQPAPISRQPETGPAVEGVDPVGFYAGRKSVKGDPAVTTQHNGATFFFASAETRARFIADPARFAPAYGGYCTETLASGTLKADNPVSWTLHGNRLYLASSPSTQKALRENLAYTAERSERYWADAVSYVDTYGFGSSPKLVQSVRSSYRHC